MKTNATLRVWALVLMCSACASLPKGAPSKEALTPAEHTTLGHAYASNKETRLAIQQYKAAVRKDKHYIPAWMGLGNIAFEEEQYKLARGYFEKVLKIKPKDPAAVNNLAMIDLAENRPLNPTTAALED